MDVNELVARAYELGQMRSWAGQDLDDYNDIGDLLVERFGLDPRVVMETGRIWFLAHGDAYLTYHDPIMRAFMEFRTSEDFNKDKPLIVDAYSPDLLLLHRVILNGQMTLAANDLLPRKAATVAFTGRRIPEAIESAQELGVTLLGGWVPVGRGTDFQGAAPFKANGEINLIFSVSGQNHTRFDQPFADAIVEEYAKVAVIAVG
jgi:hypothetical protein